MVRRRCRLPTATVVKAPFSRMSLRPTTPSSLRSPAPTGVSIARPTWVLSDATGHAPRRTVRSWMADGTKEDTDPASRPEDFRTVIAAHRRCAVIRSTGGLLRRVNKHHAH